MQRVFGEGTLWGCSSGKFPCLASQWSSQLTITPGGEGQPSRVVGVAGARLSEGLGSDVSAQPDLAWNAPSSPRHQTAPGVLVPV